MRMLPDESLTICFHYNFISVAQSSYFWPQRRKFKVLSNMFPPQITFSLFHSLKIRNWRSGDVFDVQEEFQVS